MRHLVGNGVLVRGAVLLICAGTSLVCQAQQQTAAPTPSPLPSAGKPLTVDRIYSGPSFNCRLPRGVEWTPDSKQICFFESNATVKAGRTELWAVDVASGQRHVILSADKLESVLPADSEQTTQ